MSVYFIACGGFIKVGYSRDPKQRVRNLFKSGSRYTAPRAAFEGRADRTLLRYIDGDQGTEYHLHVALRDFDAGCEWFVDEPALREWISTVEPDSDRWNRREYAPLVREGGRVVVPDGEGGGDNAELVIGVYLKSRAAAQAKAAVA